MNNFFRLELDTTAPALTLQAPYRSIPNNIVQITVIANEVISAYQEIYIVDSKSIRHDYIFSKIDDYTYSGFVDLQAFPLGIATINAQLKDEVDNASTVSKGINIGYIKGKIEIFVSCDERISEVEFAERKALLSVQERDSELSCRERNAECTYAERIASLGVE